MNTEKMSIAQRESELAAYLDKQPYLTELDGISLEIAKNVFPSDFGITSSFFGNFMLQQKPAANALDMGCGSGYFAFVLKKLGCEQVLGVDYNLDAVNCAASNIPRNPDFAPDNIIHSDLFVNVPPQKFGLIVFNFNYYPSNGDFGLNADGGKEILKRFFTQVTDYIDDDTRIYIPYSEFVGDEHNPQSICTDYGFSAETVATISNHTGLHFVFEVKKAQC